MDEKRQTSPVILAILVSLFGACVLYVLSAGPAVMLRDRGMISQDTILTIYAPLRLIQWLGPIDSLFDAYLSLWSNPPAG
jgi:hypothetical protein